MKQDTKDLLIVGGVIIGGVSLYLKKDEIEEMLPEFGGIDLSSLFEGLQFPSFGGFGGATIGGGLLPGLQMPEFDLSGLGLGLGGMPSIPQVPDFGQMLRDALGLGGGEGEEDVIISPQPDELSWGGVAKGFISEHPYLTAAIAVPASAAISYGAIKAAPYVAPVIGQAGRGIVSGVSKISSNIYSVVKLPKGINIFKAFKTAPTAKAVAAKAGGIGVGGYTLMGMFGLGLSTELSRMVGWSPEMAYKPELVGGRGVFGFINRAIAFLSPTEGVRQLFGGRVSAAPPGARGYQGELYGVSIKVPSIVEGQWGGTAKDYWSEPPEEAPSGFLGWGEKYTGGLGGD